MANTISYVARVKEMQTHSTDLWSVERTISKFVSVLLKKWSKRCMLLLFLSPPNRQKISHKKLSWWLALKGYFGLLSFMILMGVHIKSRRVLKRPSPSVQNMCPQYSITCQHIFWTMWQKCMSAYDIPARISSLFSSRYSTLLAGLDG